MSGNGRPVGFEAMLKADFEEAASLFGEQAMLWAEQRRELSESERAGLYEGELRVLFDAGLSVPEETLIAVGVRRWRLSRVTAECLVRRLAGL